MARPKHHPKPERMAWLAMMQVKALIAPDDQCLLCDRPGKLEHCTMELRDFAGGDAELDGRLTGHVCERCIGTVLSETDALHRGKA